MDKIKTEVSTSNKTMYLTGALILIGVLGVAGFVMSNNKSGDTIIMTEENKDLGAEAMETPTPEVNESKNMEEIQAEMIKESGANEAMVESDVNTVVINVTGENFKFLPNTITVKKGQAVKVNFESTNGSHNFVVDEFNAKTTQVNTDATTSVEFVADQVGSFEYYCSVGQHRANGMVGTLTVTE
ncbi:MAG: cupredoxin domain-containing protein [bacterium]|nr:cupredoxin domain-containing protein [bacterium]